ncbi:MAG: hypothetical protein KatS3mg076_1600 [Candidatus Binatia bacterium]|nr:MAG: hypothetical protein KatS3mg076_1600 [Candidatus Binatia bacterium]
MTSRGSDFYGVLGPSGKAWAWAAAVEAVARELRREFAAPRGAPFFGLDAPPGGLPDLGAFGKRGIFRKYETVLELGAGLGATARWWNAVFGCRVVGVEEALEFARAAAFLSSRSGFSADTRFVAALGRALPFRGGSFTHVWSARPIRWAAGDPRLAEALRVVRPGGHLAVAASDPEEARRAVREAGFVELRVDPLGGSPEPPTVGIARQRLAQVLTRQGHGDLAAPLREDSPGEPELFLLTARKPS